MIPSWPLLLSITGLAARSCISGGTGNGVARFIFIVTTHTPNTEHLRRSEDMFCAFISEIGDRSEEEGRGDPLRIFLFRNEKTDPRKLDFRSTLSTPRNCNFSVTSTDIDQRKTDTQKPYHNEYPCTGCHV